MAVLETRDGKELGTVSVFCMPRKGELVHLEQIAGDEMDLRVVEVTHKTKVAGGGHVVFLTVEDVTP